jgi:hypothetical protein
MSTYLFIYRSPNDHVAGSDDALAAWGAYGGRWPVID